MVKIPTPDEARAALEKECPPLILNRVELGLLMAAVMNGIHPSDEHGMALALLIMMCNDSLTSLIEKITALKSSM